MLRNYLGPFQTALAFALFACLPAIGCSTFGGTSELASLDAQPLPDEPGRQDASGAPFYTLEFRSDRGKVAGGRIALDGSSPLISEVLTKSGAFKRFSRMNVYLERPMQGQAMHRMDVHVDRAKRQVVPAFDYAIRPGDRLIVEEDPTSVIDDMLGTFTEPLGPLRRR